VATSCFTIADSEGGLAAVTQTLLGDFGSHVGVEELGFHLNNGMLWFNPEPGAVNSIAGGKRALSAMSSMIATNGKMSVAIAGLGARRIITAVSQALELYVHHGLPLMEAIDLPRIHTDGSDIRLDERAPVGVWNELRRAGFEPTAAHYGPTSTATGRLMAVEYDSSTRRASRAIDPRASSAWTDRR
jgi:gamma-glutamyltranspeptidase